MGLSYIIKKAVCYCQSFNLRLYAVSHCFKVSVLSAAGSGKPHCHWFTSTPNPQTSVFKPFIFTPAVRISHHTYSPTFDDDPAKVRTQFHLSR